MTTKNQICVALIGGTDMTDAMDGEVRAFRFGIDAPFVPDLPAWREQVRRIADQGCSTVLS